MKGDYLGFTFNNIHSSFFQIIRTADSGYEQYLSTPSEDHIIRMSDDKVYLSSSDNKNSQIIVPIAFQDMTEWQYEQFRRYYNNHVISELIFDEDPYKVYRAKITGTSAIDFYPVSRHGARFYSGTGSLEFTIISQAATSRYSFLEDYTSVNIAEWQDDIGQTGLLIVSEGDSDLLVEEGSPLLSGGKGESSSIQLLDSDLIEIDRYLGNYDNKIEWAAANYIPEKKEDNYSVINTGDYPMNWKIYLPFEQDIPEIVVSWDNKEVLKISSIKKDHSNSLEEQIKFIEFDSFDNVLYGCDLNHNRLGKIYPNIINYNYYLIPNDDRNHVMTINSQGIGKVVLVYNYSFI